ncbi:MAG: NAD(P)-dependent oxidoreductase [Planctomycetes bacterium]|nr:NAD(P)-dependent oxidoreductase [Planctomycetota bacterium]
MPEKADRKRILLTGGSGLVGRTLAPMLSGQHEVTHFEMKDPGDGLPFIGGDLRDSAAVAEACQGKDTVIHIAALHGKAWKEAGDDIGFEANVIGTKNILEGAAKAGVKRVVFTSSIWATGHGSNPPYLPIDEDLPREPAELYGLTKTLGEQMCRYTTSKHGLSTIALRPGGIRPAEEYGPNEVGYLAGSVNVCDVAQAHVLALNAPDDMRHEAFIITADSPLCKVDPEEFKANPAEALDKVVSGAAKLAAEGKLKLSPGMEWYTVAKAKKLLGYDPQYNFTIANT